MTHRRKLHRVWAISEGGRKREAIWFRDKETGLRWMRGIERDVETERRKHKMGERPHGFEYRYGGAVVPPASKRKVYTEDRYALKVSKYREARQRKQLRKDAVFWGLRKIAKPKKHTRTLHRR